MTGQPQKNAALVRRFLIDVVAGGDTDAIPLFLHGEVVDHNLVFGDETDRGGMNALGWRALAGADVTVDVADVVATDDRVAVRGTVSGIHRESLVDLAPTGESFTIAYVWFCRLCGGRITAIWSLPDGLGLLEQLGAIPPNRPLTDPTEHHQR